MGLFDIGDDDVQLENADIECEPQNEFVSEEEVKPLDDRLKPGEKIHYLFTGNGGLEINGEKDNRMGLTRTAITDGRVLVKADTGFGNDYQTIRYDNISGVSVTSGMINVAIRIDSRGTTYKFRVKQAMNSEDIAHEAVEFIRDKISQATSPDTVEQNSESAIEKLEKLRDLKEDGIISEEELEEKKEDLMDDI